MWLIHPDFVDLVKGRWDDFEVDGPPGQRFRLKLKELREVLRVWNMEVFGDIERKQNNLMDEISSWDRKEEEEGLSLSEMTIRKETQWELERVLEMKEIMWHKKSRVQWLKEGNRNIKIFHRMTSTRRSTNHIHYLHIGGDSVDNLEDMQSHMEEYFKTLFREDRLRRPKMDVMHFPLLGDG